VVWILFADAKSWRLKVATIFSTSFVVSLVSKPRPIFFTKMFTPFRASLICFFSVGEIQSPSKLSTNPKSPVEIALCSSLNSIASRLKVADIGAARLFRIGETTAAAVPGLDDAYGLLVPTLPYCCANSG